MALQELLVEAKALVAAARTHREYLERLQNSVDSDPRLQGLSEEAMQALRQIRVSHTNAITAADELEDAIGRLLTEDAV